MSAPAVTVAIPVLDGGAVLGETLQAVRGQRIEGEVELLVADSGSTDGSRERAVAAGARVLDVPRAEFSHGGTRNLLAAEARGAHVAFLTQDATPADPSWLARLLEGFGLADGVGMVFGPYRGRPGASPMVRRELDDWFAGFAPDGAPRVDRPGEEPATRADADRRRFFTDANGCVARTAWEQVPFREVSYAEDQMLARDMLSAGWAKAYHPAAAVIHSHDYPPGRLLRRSFDESRALAEVHAHRAHGGPRRLGLVVQRHVRDDLAYARPEGFSAGAVLAARSLAYHAARTVGATLGSRADRLPPRVRALLSLERRGGFDPQC
jgi:glycosyltransferase involved in cell wall biosynthesis